MNQQIKINKIEGARQRVHLRWLQRIYGISDYNFWVGFVVGIEDAQNKGTKEIIKANKTEIPDNLWNWAEWVLVDHRMTCPGEIVFDFDNDTDNTQTSRLITFLEKKGVPYSLMWHGGRSPHTHLFLHPEMAPRREIIFDWILEHAEIPHDSPDRAFLIPEHLIRAEGGRYLKKHPVIYYKSARVTTDINDVVYPEIKLVDMELFEKLI